MKSNKVKKYLIEFSVIFISITLSFLVEEWRTNRQQSTITKEFLTRLRNEITTKSGDNRIYLDYNRISLKAYDKIYKNFSSRNIPHDSLLQLCIDNQAFLSFEPGIKTWESIVSSGNINSINLTVIDSVTSLIQTYQRINWANELMIKFASEIYPTIIKDYPTDALLNAVNKLNRIPANFPTKRPNLNIFLNDNLAIDYYSALLHLTNHIDVKYYNSLSEKESRLIDLINKEID